MIARHFLISGKVQGVFFRASTAAIARRLGVDGYARNLPDGRVEIYAQADEVALQKLERWLQDGPPMARVDSVIANVVNPTDVSGFSTK